MQAENIATNGNYEDFSVLKSPLAKKKKKKKKTLSRRGSEKSVGHKAYENMIQE